MENNELQPDESKGESAQIARTTAINNDREIEQRKERVIKSLEQLYSRYHADISGTSKIHIGDCIREIHQHSSSVDHFPLIDRFPEITASIYSITELVLDQIAQGDPKLDEVDSTGVIPLHCAVREGMAECVELLLAKGANPVIETTVWNSELWGSEEYLGKWRWNMRDVEQPGAIFRRNSLVRCWHRGREKDKSIKEVTSLFWDKRIFTWRVNDIGMRMDKIIAPECFRAIAEGFKLWIHVSVTSLSTILALARIIDSLFREAEPRSHSGQFMEMVSSSFHAPAVVPSNPLMGYRDTMYESFPTNISVKSKRDSTVLVFPCLILDTIGRVSDQRQLHRDLRWLPNYRGTILDKDVGIFLQQTLDEAYSPGLDRESLMALNKDQIVTKEFLRTEGGDMSDCPILMVPQLWIWRMDNVLLSASSETNVRRRCQSKKSYEYLMRYGFDPGESINSQVAILLATSINNFGMHEQWPGSRGTMFKPPLDMFEAALISTFSSVHQYLEADRMSLKTTEQKKKELQFIHHISDIHSELDMIQSVLDQQKEVMDKFLADTKVERDGETEFANAFTWNQVVKARQTLNQYSDRISKIHKDADRAEKTIEAFLNLQRTYANIEDTQNNMLVGLAALAFAIVTVIFTPLSFMTSLFALPVREILQHQKVVETSIDPPQAPSQAFDFKYIGGYIALAGFATWIPTGILLAFLYLRWTGHFGRQQSQREPKKDDTKKIGDTDAKESNGQKMRSWVPLQEGLRRRWNVLTRRKIGAQAPNQETGASAGVEDPEKDVASKATPQGSGAEGSKTRKKDTSIV